MKSLVGGLEHVFFHSLGNFIITTDEIHHFSEGVKPHPPESHEITLFPG
jgi:predicted oxidoreductase